MTSYDLFANKDEEEVDYLIMGSDAVLRSITNKANKLIALATARKDCIATIKFTQRDLVNITNTTTQTDNRLSSLDSLTSSSYAVFDSGYKYMYDRFNNEFVFVPTN